MSLPRKRKDLTLNLLGKKIVLTATTVIVIFIQKLHFIYLVNDILHPYVRKNAAALQTAALEGVAVPMYCSAIEVATDDYFPPNSGRIRTSFSQTRH